MTARRFGIAGMVLLVLAAAQVRAEISPELASAIELTQRERPGLLQIKPGDRFLASAGDAQLDALLASIAAHLSEPLD